MNQMDKFGISLKLYANGEDDKVVHYPGQYTRLMALELAKTIRPDAPEWFWSKAGGSRMVWSQRRDLADFGVYMDTWFPESNLGGIGILALKLYFIHGCLWEEGIDGPICGVCAWALSWEQEGKVCKPCPMCTGGFESYVAPWWGHANPMSKDPALHPDNDYMPDADYEEFTEAMGS